MKKVIVILTLLILVVTFASCNHYPSTNDLNTSTSSQEVHQEGPIVDERILGIFELTVYSNVSANIRNPLSETSRKYTDSKITASKKLKLGNQTVDATYKETINFALGDTEIEMYTYNGYEIGYRNDGQLYFVNNRENGLFKIELEENDELEDIRAKIDAAATEWIDLSKYENFAGSKIEGLDNPNKTLSYRYYNEVNGYSVDTVYVYMKADGTVDVIESNENPIVNTEILYSIDEDYEKELIVAKLKDMYEPMGYSLASEDYIVWIKEAFMYDGEIYILYYSVTTTIIDSNGNSRSPDCYLLVPVSALIPTTE